MTRKLGLMAVWLAACTAGYVASVDYDTKPTNVLDNGKFWPADSRLTYSTTRPTAVMFIHPRCPCAVASLRMFERGTSHGPAAIEALLVFTKPADKPDAWCEGTAWRLAGELAEAIPWARSDIDAGGREARRFGATCAGELLIYDANGELIFHGGTTGSRGHEGDCIGSEALRAVVQGNRPSAARSAVYGCRLVLPDAAHGETP